MDVFKPKNILFEKGNALILSNINYDIDFHKNQQTFNQN
jgi:hypothetical protein